jgi:hypothetical protein
MALKDSPAIDQREQAGTAPPDVAYNIRDITDARTLKAHALSISAS